MGKENACDVCGGSETRLVDGFYYCAECGTQDTNVRETVVEHTALGDGTFAFFNKQKFSVKIKDGVQMSPEWYKWHAFNFIMAGLTGELLRLGAAPSFKTKVLWIWAKYIRKHQDKEKMFNNNILSEIKDHTDSEHSNEEQKTQKTQRRVHDITHNILVTILNIALNLDKSKIQLSHLRRFILSGHLGIERCKEYVPKEINTKLIPGWTWTLLRSKLGRYSVQRLLSSMKRCFDLGLGGYLIPNIDFMIDNQLKELCLPNDLKCLVLSLMDYAPIDYLNGDKKSNALPDFEGIVMAYILVAMKMCFGLDDDYEIRLSEAVDKINEDENHLKVYKLDMFSEPSDRLFSFREWCKYLLFRKYLHCNYNSCAAKERGLFLDDHVFMEHSEPQTKEVLLSDEVTMDIINKIPQNDDFDVIAKSKFEPSLTPLSTVTDVICHHLRDLDTRRILSEDFSQYSINYACRELALPDTSTSENIVIGVSEAGKTYNDLLGLHFVSSYSDDTMVFVRNCENKNWFKTKRPTADHIVNVKEPSDGETDRGYDSNSENTPVDSNINETRDRTSQDNINPESTLTDNNPNTNADTDDEELEHTKLEVFEEDTENNIFDDDFLNIDTKETKFADTIQNLDSTLNDTMPTLRYEDSYYEDNDLEDSKVGLQSISLIDGEEPKPTFDPTTFDRESTIKELVITACRKYKVRIPTKYRQKKRKLENPNEATVSRPKRPRKIPDEEKLMEKSETQAQVDEIITAYYRNLEQDLMKEVSEHLKSFTDNIEQDLTTTVEQDQLQNGNNDIEQCDESIIQNNDIDENESESEDESVQDPIYKGDPKFDEKTHDTKQLYLKVKGEFETEDLFDLDSDDELNKLLEEQINNPRKPVEVVESDDSDDLTLSGLCKSKKRQKTKLEKLLPNRNISEFKYWFKHYLSRVFKKYELLEKFDAEVKNAFPKSFGFVLFECAAVLDCSAYSLYRHMSDIEEKMLQRDGYVRKLACLKDTGIRMDRRDNQSRINRRKPMAK